MTRPRGAQALHLSADNVLNRVQRAGLMGAVVGLALCVAGLVVDREQFFHSYIIAYLFWFGIALGSLAVLMLQYLTGGRWGAVVRRILEAGSRTLPLMALLFVPLALGIPHLYHWAHADAVAHDAILRQKALYLNVPFFLVRAVLYFAIWITITRFLNRWSLEQDARPDPACERRLELLSRGGIVLYVLTMTFAAIDWAMSLDPHWFSTIYGVMFIGGQGLSTFAFVILVCAMLADRPPMSEILSADRFHDLGKLMLAFVILWAYFFFSQFLIMWSGNLPEEIPFYLRRTQGGWQYLGILLVIFHFALPFLVLLSRDIKRRARTLAAVASVVIVFRMVDLFWQIRPFSEPEHLALHWLDLAAVVGVGGIWLWAFVGQLKGRPLVPMHDPYLPGVAEEAGI